MHGEHSSHYHLKVGIAFILLTWLFFTLMSPLIRKVSHHLPMSTILCVQGIVGILCVLPWMLKHGMDSFKTKDWGLIILRTICGLLGYLLLFLSILHTSLIDAFLLNNAAPLFLPIVIWIWRKKPIEHKLWLGLIGGFIGLLFILKPGAEILNIGVLYGLGNALVVAIIMVSLRLLSFTTRSSTVLFYFFLFSALATLPLVLMSGKFPSNIEWIELLTIGILSTLAQLALTRAFHYANPMVLGPFNYSAVIFAGLLDYFLYESSPDIFSWIGVVLVILGGIWSIRFSRKLPPPSQSPKLKK